MAAVWALLSLLGKGRRNPQGTSQSGLPDRPRLPTLPDATQREGKRLEMVLRELQRSLEEAAQPDRPAGRALPGAGQLSERRPVETVAEVVSLEGEVHREARQRVDRDEETRNIEAERIEAASARNVGRPKLTVAAIAQPVRQEVRDHTATRTYS